MVPSVCWYGMMINSAEHAKSVQILVHHQLVFDPINHAPILVAYNHAHHNKALMVHKLTAIIHHISVGYSL